MSVLVIAEHDNAELKPATLNTVAAAAQLGDVDILLPVITVILLLIQLQKLQVSAKFLRPTHRR